MNHPTPAPSFYAKRISEILGPERPGYDPRHVEAFMRLEYSTLDHLSRSAFAREINIAVECIDAIGPDEAEKCAKSFGF